MIQPYDIAMLIVLVGALLFGVIKGAAWQVASIASVVVSSMVAAHCSASLSPYFPAKEPLNRYLAMLSLFVATSAAIWIVFRFVSSLINRIKLKDFDRQIGAMIGLAKGVLYCIIITFFAVMLSEQSRQWVLGTQSGHLVAEAISKATPLLPGDTTAQLAKYIDDFNRKLASPPEATPASGTATSSPTPVLPNFGGTNSSLNSSGK
jgi:membrane protein required for colicin V production